MGEASFIVFRHQPQRMEFEAFVISNFGLLDSIPEDAGAAGVQERIRKDGKYFIFNPVEMVKLKFLFGQWCDEPRID